MIRVVAFDADDTLLDFRMSMWSSLEAVLPQIHALTPAAAELTTEDLDAEWRAVVGGASASLRDTRREAFRRSLARLGIADDEVIDRIDQAYYAHRQRSTCAYPEAGPVLRELRRDYRLGYATNGNSDPRHAGLDRIFAFEVYARIDGLLPKPAPAFFDRVIELSGVDVEEIAYVGDDWTNDVLAATTAGMTAIWLNRAGQDRPGNLQVAEIKSLAQLPGVLAAL